MYSIRSPVVSRTPERCPLRSAGSRMPKACIAHVPLRDATISAPTSRQWRLYAETNGSYTIEDETPGAPGTPDLFFLKWLNDIKSYQQRGRKPPAGFITNKLIDFTKVPEQDIDYRMTATVKAMEFLFADWEDVNSRSRLLDVFNSGIRDNKSLRQNLRTSSVFLERLRHAISLACFEDETFTDINHLKNAARLQILFGVYCQPYWKILAERGVPDLDSRSVSSLYNVAYVVKKRRVAHNLGWVEAVDTTLDKAVKATQGDMRVDDLIAVLRIWNSRLSRTDREARAEQIPVSVTDAVCEAAERLAPEMDETNIATLLIDWAKTGLTVETVPGSVGAAMVRAAPEMKPRQIALTLAALANLQHDADKIPTDVLSAVERNVEDMNEKDKEIVARSWSRIGLPEGKVPEGIQETYANLEPREPERVLAISQVN